MYLRSPSKRVFAKLRIVKSSGTFSGANARSRNASICSLPSSDSRITLDEIRVHPQRRIGRDAVAEQPASGARVDDLGAERAQLVDSLLDDRGALARAVAERGVHVLAQHADAQAVEPRFACEGLVGHVGQAADAEGRHLVLRVVTRDHAQDSRGVLDRAADRAGARVDAGADHAVAAHELLRGRNADRVVRDGRAADRRARLFRDRAGDEVRRDRGTRARARRVRRAFRVVRVAERAAESTPRAARRVLREIRFRENDCARVTQALHERRIVGRTVVGPKCVAARGRAHVVRVVLVLDRDDDAVQRPHELAGGREVLVERCRDLERVGHRWIGVDGIGHAARLARVEAPLLARCGPEVQRRQRVDLTRVRNRLDAAEHAVGLLHAGTVVRLDPLEILLDALPGRPSPGWPKWCPGCCCWCC